MSLSNSFNSRGQLSPSPYDLDLSNRLILLLVLIENLMQFALELLYLVAQLQKVRES